MKDDPRIAPYVVFEAFDNAECLYMCWDTADVKRAIENMVNLHGCHAEDVVVLKTKNSIPFSFKKVEQVEISL